MILLDYKWAFHVMKEKFQKNHIQFNYKKLYSIIGLVTFLFYFLNYNACKENKTVQILLPFSCHLPLTSYRPWQILLLAPSVHTDLTNVSFCWLVNTGVSMCRSPLKNIVYDFVLTSAVLPNMSCLSYLDGLWDGR